MLVLKELSQIVEQNKLSFPSLLDLHQTNHPFAEAYLNIKNGTFSQEEQVSDYFCGTDKTNPIYKKFKQNLKRELVNHVLLFTPSVQKHNDRQRAYYTIYKDWAAIKILLAQNAWIAAKSILLKIYKLALKYEFYDILVETTKILRLYYSTRDGDLKKYTHYNQLFHQYREIRNAEEIVETYYTDLVVHSVQRKAVNSETHQQALHNYKKIEPYIQKYDSYWLQLCGRLIELTIPSATNDYKATIEVCNKAITFFKSKPFNTNVALQAFFYQKITSHTQLKEYNHSKRSIEELINITTKGTSNWFLYQRAYFILSIHTKQYNLAMNIFLDAINQKRFVFLPKASQEMWYIFEANLYLLYLVGFINTKQGIQHLSKFKVGKFLNNTPIFSLDKRGMNIPILITQISIMLTKKNYSGVTERIERVNKYCSRYLKINETFRSNCFIKMLLTIPNSNFHKVAVIRKSTKLYDRLKKVPLEIAKQTHDIEIIPYEDIWELALNSLENKHYFKR